MSAGTGTAQGVSLLMRIGRGGPVTMLGLVLVRLAHQTARTRALRPLTLVIGHADKWLHKAGTVDKF